MPYIFIEELEEGYEAADVVEREEYESIVSQLEEARNQRDEAIERAQSAEDGYSKMREKYANTFLSKPKSTPERSSEPVLPQSIDELFN